MKDGKCTKCRRSLALDAVFCDRCGRELVRHFTGDKKIIPPFPKKE